MIADGIFISKLIYLMPAWSGCEDYLVDALQVCQNRAARLVTKLDRFTPTKVLLKQCGWLSVKQLMVYHSLILLRKVFKNQKPLYLYQKITSGSPQRNTRQSIAKARTLAAAGILSQPCIPDCDLSLTRKSWCNQRKIRRFSKLELLAGNSKRRFEKILEHLTIRILDLEFKID